MVIVKNGIICLQKVKNYLMQLENYKEAWKSKKVLRLIYKDFYNIISSHCIDGNILEIGGGIGNFEISGRKIIKTDVQNSDSINFVADAHNLPISDSSFENIVLIDVLHHLDCPVNFLKEASRVLKKNGRIIMIEPGISPVSWFLYKIGHDEEVDMSWQASMDCVPDSGKKPYDSNQAIPTLLFNRSNAILDNLNLSVMNKKWLSLFVYPLSGGFQKWSLIPSSFVSFMLKVESKILPFLGPIMAFRLVVVLKNTKPN